MVCWGEQVQGLLLVFTLCTSFMAKKALKATIHSLAFSSVAHNSRVALSTQDIKDEKFWKAIYCLLRAVFPCLKVLRYCDASYPAYAKDEIYYLAQRANDVILKSALDFDDVDLFGPMQDTNLTTIDLEMTKVYGEKLEMKGNIHIYILISSYLF